MNQMETNKKYFVISDIHSFAKEMKSALRRAGFNKRSKNHILIVCGDACDRGDETLEVIRYLQSVPKKRCILIRGNHEALYEDLLTKSFPESYDFSNGTVKTCCALAGVDPNMVDFRQMRLTRFENDPPLTGEQINNKIHAIWDNVRITLRDHPYTKWLKSKQWVNYYELDNFIFVHSFIPVKIKDIPETKWMRNFPTYEVNDEDLEYNPDWRDAAEYEWYEASWGCPYRQFDAGLFKPEANKGKVLVCGHWDTGSFHTHYNQDTENSEIYFSKNLIALDACTVLTHHCNVLVIENGKCYDRFGKELKYE